MGRSRPIAEGVAIAVLSPTVRRPHAVIGNAGLAMERETAVPGVGLAREDDPATRSVSIALAVATS